MSRVRITRKMRVTMVILTAISTLAILICVAMSGWETNQNRLTTDHISAPSTRTLIYSESVFRRPTDLWRCDVWQPSAPVESCQLHVRKMSWGAANIRFVPDPSGDSGKVLEVFYPKGHFCRKIGNSGGVGFSASPFRPSDAMTLEYEVRFSSNFDFVQGGKLPGLYGGSSSCKGGLHFKPQSCFSARFMWRAGGYGEVYLYIPAETNFTFCNLNPDVVCNFEFGHSLGRGRFRFSCEKWHHLSQYIKLNSPGKRDGIIKVSFDSKEVYRIDGLTFRRDKKLLIDALLFNTFFGGHTKEWASTANVSTYYRRFRFLRH